LLRVYFCPHNEIIKLVIVIAASMVLQATETGLIWTNLDKTFVQNGQTLPVLFNSQVKKQKFFQKK